jgi:hypothetical protein
MFGFTVGTLVKARRTLDKDGANVKRGTLGVVFEPTVYVKNAGTFDDAGPAHGGHVAYGPNVRWFTGAVCNVYPGDVEHVAGSERLFGGILAGALDVVGRRLPARHGRVAVQAWVYSRMHAADVAREHGVRPHYAQPK